MSPTNPSPPAYIHDPTIRANLEAKVRRLAAVFAEQEHEGPTATLTIRIGSAPWETALTADLVVTDGRVSPADAEAGILAALSAWYASHPPEPAAPADIPGATAEPGTAPAAPTEGA